MNIIDNGAKGAQGKPAEIFIRRNEEDRTELSLVIPPATAGEQELFVLLSLIVKLWRRPSLAGTLETLEDKVREFLAR
jgi:hypothetical protein